MKNLSRKMFLLGIAIFVVFYLLPIDIFETYTNLRPTGLASIFICPMIGLVGLILGIKEKDGVFIVLNLLLILILPLIMFVGQLLGAM